MSNPTDLKVPKWPFFLADAVMLAAACFITVAAKRPLGQWEAAAVLVCGLGGGLFGIRPFLLEYRAAFQAAETAGLVSVAGQLKNLELLAAQIAVATAQWQAVQELSGKTVEAAKDIAGKIGAEAAAFSEFLQKANESEKANLRLEVEKLRRAESDWLQVVVRVLDHTYALHQAAVRSGQAGLIEQLGQFQNACRDAARRIGLVPVAPTAGEPFKDKLHQLPGGQESPPEGALVRETIATGYTFQGQLVRPPLVALQTPAPPAEPAAEAESGAVESRPETAPETEEKEAAEQPPLI
jgi:molecular chaperone GrpE (heat shock protein)